MVASLEAVGSDDIFYDASKTRVYVPGNPTRTDAREVAPASWRCFSRKMPTTMPRLRRLDWPLRARVGKLFVVTRRQGDKSGEILVYETN